jgi:hypothetical protein
LPKLAIECVALLAIAVLLGACAEDAPVDRRMHDANEVVARYCTPIPGLGRPDAGDLRAALARIAERERDDPDGQFRIDDSEDPTTAGQLLDDVARYARERDTRCERIAVAIGRARAE